MQIPLPTREIAWNAGEVGVAAMYLLMIVQGLVLAYVGTRRYLIWRSGRPYGPLGDVVLGYARCLAWCSCTSA